MQKFKFMSLEANKNTIWDVVVIGGGPSGMMAASSAARNGKKVLLLEKNKTLGKKLLITGGGRCNVTNNKTDIRIMLAKYKEASKFLYSTFSQFDVASAVQFFKERGVEMKEENEGRMFPVSNKAQSVYDVLLNEMNKVGVIVRTDSSVIAIKKNSGTFLIEIKNSDTVVAKKCVVAVGGTGRPETGSTGDGFKWLKDLGHTIVVNNAALVPVKLHNTWVKDVTGVTLENVKVTVCVDGKKESSAKGKILFTHFGVSGPMILNMSKEIGDLLNEGEVTLKLDLFPGKDESEVKKNIQALLVEHSNKKIKNVLTELFPASFVSVILREVKIDGETFSHSVRSEERVRLMRLLKNLILRVDSLLGEDKAIVSSGGVTLEEVDFKTMESKKVEGLYLVGDMLNIDRPSGGYSLQLCWSTGFVAGISSGMYN